MLTFPVVEKSLNNFTFGTHLPGSTFSDSTNHRSCTTVIHISEKNSCVSGPALFKPVLVRGPLYVDVYFRTIMEGRPNIAEDF